MTLKRIKYLEINLTKENVRFVQKLLREIKDNINKWRNSSVSLNGRLGIVQMAFIPKLIFRSNTMPIKILAEIGKADPKIYMKMQRA